MTKVRCENEDCEWTGDIEQTRDMNDFWGRVAPGDEMPAGECPECGWLAYVVKEKDELPHVIAVVSGGMVETVRSDTPINVEVADLDVLKDGCGDLDEAEAARIRALAAKAEHLPYDCLES